MWAIVSIICTVVRKKALRIRFLFVVLIVASCALSVVILIGVGWLVLHACCTVRYRTGMSCMIIIFSHFGFVVACVARRTDRQKPTFIQQIIHTQNTQHKTHREAPRSSEQRPSFVTGSSRQLFIWSI